MARCAFIKPGGERCGATAMAGYDHCYGHRADLAGERKRNASKGGKRGGNGRGGVSGVAQVRGEIRGVLSGVLSGTINRSVGAVCFQGFNSLLKAYETERRLRELDEIEERLEALEQREAARKTSYGNR